MEKVERIKELVQLLNKASQKYYMEDTEIMSNLEYDRLYDELVNLEQETGIVMGNSPTVNVGYEVVSELPKEAHEHPMLSLDKTKDVEALAAWLGENKGVISWKMDGLTVVLTYEDGQLVKAITRGNGEVGELITANAKMFVNVPHSIAYKGKLTIRGEAVIKYSDFNAINEKLAAGEEKYKNPRNLCSGAVRQLNNKITKERNVNFFAFSLVDGEDVDFKNSFSYQLGWIKSLGFDVVENFLVDGSSLPERVKYFSEKISRNDFPSDGLVLVLDDIAYGKSLGRTAKFPRNAMAFKWADEQAVTHLVEVCWSPSRTGLINPIAVFEPVELEGTTVSRASLHNVSILKSLQLGIGDEISVYKANMIIPQIAENFTRSGTLEIPKICPVCGDEARIRREGQAVFDLREAGSEIVAGDSNGLPAESMATSSNSGEESVGAGGAELNTEDSNKDGMVETLYCVNKFCPAKKIKSFSHFVSREAMNIDGVSQATLEKFIDENILETLPDIYHLADHREKIVGLEGFGEKSYNKLCDSIDKSRETDTWRLVNALGIPNVGEATAKLIARHFDNDMKKIMAGTQSECTEIEGIGDVVAASIVGYFNNESNCDIIDRLMDELSFAENTEQSKDNLSGQVFVITGSLTHFENRNQLKELIENQGGKVTGSVSANTTYLINNDVNSTSSKNKKAKSLGIPIISEEDFIEMFKD